MAKKLSRSPGPVPDLGSLRRPRKTNRIALRRIAEGDRLWDHRAVARAAERAARRRTNGGRLARQLDAPRRQSLLRVLGPGWSWDLDGVVPVLVRDHSLVDDPVPLLVRGLSRVPGRDVPVALAVAGLDEDQSRELLSGLPQRRLVLFRRGEHGSIQRVRAARVMLAGGR